jgi:hypothetical protein
MGTKLETLNEIMKQDEFAHLMSWQISSVSRNCEAPNCKALGAMSSSVFGGHLTSMNIPCPKTERCYILSSLGMERNYACSRCKIPPTLNK